MPKRKKTVYNIEQELDLLIPSKNMYVPRYTESQSGYPGYSRGAHAMHFRFMGIQFWFSYDTLIAFKFPNENPVMIENSWGPTTGRHMHEVRRNNYAPVLQVPEEDFMVMYANSCKRFGLRSGPEYQVECEPGTWERTGYVVPRKEGHPDSPVKFEDENLDPPEPRTKAEKARARAIQRKKEADARRKAKVRSMAAREAARTRKRREKEAARQQRQLQREGKDIQKNVIFQINELGKEMI